MKTAPKKYNATPIIIFGKKKEMVGKEESCWNVSHFSPRIPDILLLVLTFFNSASFQVLHLFAGAHVGIYASIFARRYRLVLPRLPFSLQHALVIPGAQDECASRTDEVCEDIKGVKMAGLYHQAKLVHIV